MTTAKKIARRKLSLLELAAEMKNVSRACTIMGYSRQQFEPPRDCRRLHYLRGWSHDKSNQILPRGKGSSGTDGAGAPGGVGFAMGSHQFDCPKDRLHL